MRRILGALAVAVVLTACGGTDWNSSQAGTPAPAAAKATKSSKSTPSKGGTPATAEAIAAEQPYIDAIVQRDVIDNTDPTVKSADFRCTATALVRGYGVAAFTDNGLTPDGMRRADTSLDDLPAPTDAQMDSIGAALQRCNITLAGAHALATDLTISDAATVNCLAGRLASDPNARRLLVLHVLDRSVDLMTAHQIVGLIAACVDLPSYILQLAGVQTDPATRACLVDQLKGSEDLLKDEMALDISKTQPDLEEQDSEAIGVSVNRCRPTSHEGFTVPSSG